VFKTLPATILLELVVKLLGVIADLGVIVLATLVVVPLTPETFYSPKIFFVVKVLVDAVFLVAPKALVIGAFIDEEKGCFCNEGFNVDYLLIAVLG
jgi:hypothetical protein